MEPRILLISKDKKDLEPLQHIFSEIDIYSRCEGIHTSDIQTLLLENDINVILLDESCFSMLSELNSIARDTRVIIILHHHNEEKIKVSINYNVDGFLLKPRYYNLLPTIYNALVKKHNSIN